MVQRSRPARAAPCAPAPASARGAIRVCVFTRALHACRFITALMSRRAGALTGGDLRVPVRAVDAARRRRRVNAIHGARCSAAARERGQPGVMTRPGPRARPAGARPPHAPPTSLPYPLRPLCSPPGEPSAGLSRRRPIPTNTSFN
ncbi:hypothetical protein EVAR_7447_1 [Eumeta japonica]|uniref:Uncharacterized protein n=1 Tax=Eumeta variegata TaxID=151549 RepID=A0A4C1V8R9_EUMVA|nr:hypothetical protein EVAR_7447_1 [Eumeta japonica]